MNATQPSRAQPTGPAADRLRVDAEYRMIAADILAEDDQVQVAEPWA